MKRIKRKKLVYKFLLFVLPLLILSIVVTSIILSWTNYKHFMMTIEQDYKNIIKTSAGEIRLFVKNAQQELEGLALVVAATKLDNWQKEIALNAFNHAADQFISVSLLSQDENLIVSTNPEKENIDSGQGEIFKKALAGETAISKVIVNQDKIPFMYMAVPISHLGEVKEVLCGKLNLKSVWDVLEGIKIGRTGHVCIMDTSGRFIAHEDFHRVVMTGLPESPEMLKKTLESDTPVKYIKEKNGTKFYCLGYHVKDLGWIIVLSQAWPEIFVYLNQNIYRAIFLTALICLFAIILSWHRVKRFLTPIQSLHAQVRRISQGDFDQKVSSESNDEIGDLGQAFNEMTDSLKEFISKEVETTKKLVHAKNLAVIGSTSSKVTHEVGNLLNNLGLAILTLKLETLSPRGKKTIELIEKDVVRVKEFILNFLQFAKKPKMNLEKVSMEIIFQELSMAYQQEAEKRGIHFELNWPPDLPPVIVDSSLMYQAMNNLIKNSLEAMKDHGNITIEGKIQNGQLLILVEDTGSGIKEDVLAHVFDPFFTTKGKKGTGLGLSIVKTIVEIHRGSIECHSELDKGTTFIVRLPLH
jgi:signal transduction histidine kinase